MIRLLLIALFLYVAWSYYWNPNRGLQTRNTPPTSAAAVAEPSEPPSDSKFKCDGRVHCGQMASRAEAKFFSKHCPNTKMDGDRDGVPCEDDARFHR
jgi:hypothetical protein